jgi:cytochrome o ubiquinol oxidase subunit III
MSTLSTAVEAENTDKALLGFWLYIMTDCVLFASLFATYAVLRNNTFGGPAGAQLFHLPYILVETIALLTSSFTCGLALLSARLRDKNTALLWFGLTFVLGAVFLGMELSEFHKLALDGNSWTRSGFLSSYFTLVGTHGLHISVGLLWMATMMVRIWRSGISNISLKRLQMLSMFWHFLDVVWIFIFTIVYLTGAL